MNNIDNIKTQFNNLTEKNKSIVILIAKLLKSVEDIEGKYEQNSDINKADNLIYLTDWTMIYSKRIMELCSEKKMTVKELTLKSGVPLHIMNDILSGEIDNVRLDTLKEICRVLDISVRDFFDCDDFNNMKINKLK